MAILLTNSQKELPINELKLKRRLGKVLKEINLKDKSISVLLTTDATMKDLNREFLGKNKTTNVLAFPAEGPPRDGKSKVNAPKDIPGLKDYLGDIALSTTEVKREAKTLELPTGYLFYFYLIHAILHLAGYDHELGDEEDKRQDKETRRLMELIPHSLE